MAKIVLFVLSLKKNFLTHDSVFSLLKYFDKRNWKRTILVEA